MNNIFAMPIGLRGTSTVWHNDTKIGICLTSNNSPLLGNFVPLNEISVMDNKGDNPCLKMNSKPLQKLEQIFTKLNQNTKTLCYFVQMKKK